MARMALALGLSAVPLAGATPPAWTVVKTPHFTVLTPGKAAVAQAWATDLERLRMALGMFMPVNQARLRPVVMVIFPSASQFKPYLVMRKGEPILADGYFIRPDNINVIGLTAGAINPARVRQIIFHEATHWHSSARNDVLPLWLEEGLAEVFSTFEGSDNGFVIGQTLKDHVAYLQYVGVTKPEQLVDTTFQQMDYYDSDRTGRFYAGSWLLVHWVMFGEKAPGMKSLVRYVKLIRAGESTEKAFATAFGGDYRTVEKLLYRYCQDGRFATPRIRGPMKPPGIEAPRKATEAEVEYALGALLLGARGAQDALPHLLRAHGLDAEDPAIDEALGFAQFHLGHKAEALAIFNRVIENGSKNGQVWADRMALQQELAGDGQSPVALARSVADCRQAISLDPRCQLAYRGLAVMAYELEPADPDDARRLAVGRKIFPDDGWIKAGLILTRLHTDGPAARAELEALMADSSLSPDLRKNIGDILAKEKAKPVVEAGH